MLASSGWSLKREPSARDESRCAAICVKRALSPGAKLSPTRAPQHIRPSLLPVDFFIDKDNGSRRE